MHRTREKGVQCTLSGIQQIHLILKACFELSQFKNNVGNLKKILNKFANRTCEEEKNLQMNCYS